MATFSERLTEAVRTKKTPAIVGLDPRLNLLPASLRPDDTSDLSGVAQAFESFCCDVIDVVSPLVPAVKPQAAFFEQYGSAGTTALAKVIRYARQAGLIVLLDAKRGDIGSTAEAYAAAYLGHSSPWGADALTVNPYLGSDTLEPFVDACQRSHAGIFVLVKTSNPGSGDLQDLTVDDRSVFSRVAEAVEGFSATRCDSTGLGPVGAVVGATYPAQLRELRESMPHCWLLVPGFGAQGGSAKDVAGAFLPSGQGALINSSRGILFAHRAEPYAQRFGDAKWQAAVEAATESMIGMLASDTDAGNLKA